MDEDFVGKNISQQGNGTNATFQILDLGPVMSLWEAIALITVLGIIIIVTIVGNILVVLSVFMYRPLRTVQNFFIVSLAVADLTVAILVLPLNVATTILGKWIFGSALCKMWLTCDVLCCTSSILNLCVIALDRYWAITDPIRYAQKRTVKRVVVLIIIVWFLSGLISSPPLIGWNDWPDVFDETTPCILSSQKGYIVYSSLGSFYVPLIIMTSVYLKIYIATKRRLRKRAKTVSFGKSAQTSFQKSKTSNNKRKENSGPNHSESGYVEGNGNHQAVALQEPTTNSDPTPRKSKKQRKRKSKFRSKRSRRRGSEMDASELDSSCENIIEMHSSVKTITTNVSQFFEQKQKISLSKERRAARTLGIIMGTFIVCWLPFFLMYVILPFCQSCPEPGPVFINFITWLGYINSSLNPIIYTIFNLDFRRAFARLLSCVKM